MREMMAYQHQLISQALIPLMQGSGRVVNVSSGMGSSRR
jgi:NAD(P)-dependent dehydrogenase (short-subunit alcohol dehydrogenase family)